MKSQSGFTMIELIVVIVILGILAAVAVPKYVDMRSEALISAKAGMAGVVKSAHSLAIAKKAIAAGAFTYPSVTDVVAQITGEKVTAVPAGVEVYIDGTAYTVPTYTKDDCTSATTAAADLVLCVGSIL